MKRNKQLIEKAITTLVKPMGFTKQGTVWSRQMGDTLLGVHLQGSQYAPLAYVNFMAWYPRLADAPHGSFARGDFHLSFRGDGDRPPEIDAELRYDDAEVELDAYAARLNHLFFSAAIQKLISLADVEIALDACRADEPLNFALSLWQAAHGKKGLDS